MRGSMKPNLKFKQDAENVRQRRSRFANELNVPQGYASLIRVAAALLDGHLSIPTTMGRRYREAWFVKRISLGIEDIRNIL